MKTKGKRVCPLCGTLFADNSESCPVCALRGALKLQSDSGSDISSELRFEHYTVLQNADGTPIELGHGAMGVTYKAVDVNLRCAVALKVVNVGLIGDESARRRFVREARAAASVRHPNVASVFHLGTSSNNYFYAMELVDGEPLNKLVRRSGRLEAKLALEITTQVAAGLAAVHKQNLVHRDIKPSNIMVSLDGESVTAKIIDLGLAKAPAQSQSETVGSIPGSFAGTPEFASPEQFAGVGVDIRSDLYSLGVTLWQMLSGKLPFRGTPAELMHQHLHGPLTLEQLTGVPQPVVVLLKVLLEKDPAQRFQSPVELLRVMPTIDIAVADGRTIEHKCLGKVTSEPMRLRQTATEDLTAYDLYLRGIALVELLDRATNQKAIDVLKTAIDRDPNFALAHAGLARAYLERNIRFGAEKSLLDSAVESCRLAIALDPNEVCSYTLLAQAYYSKGWYPQGDQALRKALDLAPDDGRANNLAGDRRFSREEFDKAHAFFRKAQSVSPNEPRWAYRLAEFCWKIDEPDLAERWMQIALEKDTNPHRHRVREIAGMMFRREFAAARAAFAQLPPELQGYDSYTFEYFLTCTMCVGDWPTVIRSINSYLEENPNAIWPRIYLAIALQKADRKAEAREIAEQVAKRGLNRLKQPGEPDVPLEVPLYIACAYRLLNRKGDAYHFLAKYLADSSFLDLCFGLNDPILDPFRADPEFEPIRMNLNNKIEIARLAINEQEAASAQGPPLVEEFSSRQKNHLQSKRPNGVLPYCRSTL